MLKLRKSIFNHLDTETVSEVSGLHTNDVIDGIETESLVGFALIT